MLEKRFGGKDFVDKHRIEMRNRRRKPNESLQDLHSDIRRLAALAFPQLDHKTQESIACDYFMEALADSDLIFRIREKQPTSLDAAFRIAQQFELSIETTNQKTKEDEGKLPNGYAKSL